MKFILAVFVVFISFLSFAEEGVMIEFEKDGVKDFRSSRLAALYVKEGTSASPFINSGKFKATFKGYLSLKERSRVFFKVIGRGKVTLKIAGEEIIKAEGDDLSKVVSERHRLNQGEHEISLEYESPKKGDAQVRLLWMGRKFPWEPIGPTYLKHNKDDNLTKADMLRSGREEFANLNCIKCHSAGELKQTEVMPELLRDTPSLANAGNKFSESWMATWIQNPKHLRHNATMPKLLKHESVAKAIEAGDTSAVDLAAYLASRKSEEVPAVKSDANAIKDGGDIFHKLGCVACHTRPDKSAENERVPLNNIAWKFKSISVLTAFLKNPAKHYKWIKMPDFELNDKDAKSLAAYIMSGKPDKAETAKGNAENGKKLYESIGCATCHEPNAKATAKSLADLSKGSLSGCLDGKNADYSLSAKQKDSIRTLLKTSVDSLKKKASAEFAERQIREVNCTACHQYDTQVSDLSKFHHETNDLVAHEGSHLDQSRPILTWFGEKLQPDYLKKILAGEVDQRPRPWLDAKMPAFKERSALLAEALAAAHGFSDKFEEGPKAETDFEKIGKKLTGTQGGFSCIICHDAGPKKAIAAFEVKGIDLMLTKERLRPDYYLRWMLDPPRIVPHTKMPKFSNDGVTALTQDFQGDAAKQFWAIFEFLKQGRKIEAVK